MSQNKLGAGNGKGHGGNTANLAIIRERELSPFELQAQAAGRIEPKLKAYKAGKIQIMVGWHPVMGWHMSISHPEHYPTWDEVANARYQLMPSDIEFGMMLPPPDAYINIHNFCFHLHEMPINVDTLPKPSTISGDGGPKW